MNKKTILKTIFASLLLAIILLPSVAGAAYNSAPISPTNVNDNFRNTSVMIVVQNIANYIIAFITILGIIFIVWGAIQYVTAGGDEGAVEKAKSTIMYALIGLFVAAMAYALEVLVLSTLV